MTVVVTIWLCVAAATAAAVAVIRVHWRDRPDPVDQAWRDQPAEIRPTLSDLDLADLYADYWHYRRTGELPPALDVRSIP